MAVRYIGATTAGGSPIGATDLQVAAPAGVRAGDALVLVATCVSASNGTIATPDGWVARHTITAPHARVMLTREATGDTNDNVTLTADVTGAFCATMVAYRGIAPDAWQGATSIDTSSPFTSGAHEPADGVLVCAFSMQNNSGMHGLPTEWVGLDGNLRAFTWGGMTSSYGATNGIIDKLEAEGNVSVTVQTTGVGESGGAVQWLELWNAEVLPEERDPTLESPVIVHLGENMNGVFADPSVDVTFFQNVDLDVGSVNTIGDQLSGGPWYRFAVRDRSRSRGLVSYTGETLLTRLSRMRPRESLILVAGDGGVPNPLTLQECLRRFLTFYGVPFKEPLPPFFLRTSTGIVTPTAQAFVIQPDQENPKSVFDWLELFFGPFRGYTWRADADDELVVKPPAWAEATGLRFHLYRSSPVQQRSDLTYPWPWPGRAPTVEYRLTVEGETVTGTIGPLEAGVAEELIEGVLEFELTWAGDGETLQVERTAPFGFAPVFDAVFIAKPAADDVEGELELTVDDLTPDETETSTADSVYTQAIIPVRERTFQADQPLMQPAAIVLKSPEQLAAGAFGANVPFGPMEWAPESPEGFLELVNDDAQAGTWFWPVDPEAVPQPGGAVTVEYEVEEWAEQWRGALASAHEPAYQANTHSDSVTVDTNGLEVKVLDFEFPAQTSGFPGSFTARGSLYARWRSGDEPGIELTVRNGRFVEWGFLWEGIGGQTVYFLWGVIVRLNGTGVVWTVGDLQVARFGFSRNADGTWEGGANVPGLAEAQRLFPNRVFQSPELPYQVDPATALSIARAVVEENHVPKVVYQLPLAPAREQGWAYHPRHLGGAVDVPALGVKGRVTAHDYTESHSPGGSSSALVVDVEVAQAMPNTPAAPTGRRFGRGKYGVTTYQPTEEE